MTFLVTCSVLLWVAARAALAAGELPRRLTVEPAAPGILTIALDTGVATLGQQRPYHPETGDKIHSSQPFGARFLQRNGIDIGTVVGTHQTLWMPFDTFAPDDLDLGWLTQTDHVWLASLDDSDFKIPQAPLAIYRKSYPTGLARTGGWSFQTPIRHRLYFKFKFHPKGGRNYTLLFKGDRIGPQHFKQDPYVKRSEAVHLGQIGFHPYDPVKVGFLSLWLGNGQGHTFDMPQPFVVIAEDRDRVVYKGFAELSKAAASHDEDPYNRNYNLTDVYRLDFSDFVTPGTYRIYVEGVGCSEPFRIDEDVWLMAFKLAARGFYHQRSGIALGPPYTDFVRPRSFHPADGLRVYASTCSLMDSGNGLNAKGSDSDNFGNLVRGRTDEVVSNAWGGYFDAGDWDRRIQHLEATRLLLELVELFPAAASAVTLQIPESTNALPDLIDEALWNLDCYRRMQRPDGAIRGGIESAEHPRLGEGSWQESLPVMAYAPDLWSSYIYAGDAARVAGCLRFFGRSESERYYESALRAMVWAEREWQRHSDVDLPPAVRDARNLA
ncbi:MAG: glycoside hydrolase family 9 protein, partial [Verrucomicrobia bacterium]|nr:glycoside hydrolase family 9 protein [Verrucomicrobiota bacterium]